MKLDKAIQIKLQWRKDGYPPALADEMNADMLSIEAMKRFKMLREVIRVPYTDPLPGEDPE